MVAPGVAERGSNRSPAARRPISLPACTKEPENSTSKRTTRCSKRSSGGENPYLLHQELGQVMTKAATVVRLNATLKEAYGKVSELAERAERCSLSDTGAWTNQNVVFTKALCDMFPLAKAILKGALQRDECRGAHYKPEFALPGLSTPTDSGRTSPRGGSLVRPVRGEHRRNGSRRRSPRSVADGEPELTYEEVDTSLIPPRPRLYGLVGAEAIEEVWKQRQAAKAPASPDGNGSQAKGAVASASH